MFLETSDQNVKLGLGLAASGNLHATGVPVFDASNLAQAIAQATTLTEQLTALQQQLDT
ncbi:MAG TPA: type IV secretion system protein, partial [Chromatiaceae bacterium]|nr:type IV secretion system protein [Chromatiaceae bacterium]